MTRYTDVCKTVCKDEWMERWRDGRMDPSIGALGTAPELVRGSLTVSMRQEQRQQRLEGTREDEWIREICALVWFLRRSPIAHVIISGMVGSSVV